MPNLDNKQYTGLRGVYLKSAGSSAGAIRFPNLSSAPISTSTEYGLYVKSGSLVFYGAGSETTVGAAGGGVASWDTLYDLDSTLTVDSTSLTFAGTHATNDVVTFTNATGTGDCIQITNSGTGKDIQGTSDTWSISKAGALLVKTIAHPTTDTALTIDANGTGKVTIAGTSTGNIELQSNITADTSKTFTMAGADGSNILVLTAGDAVLSNGSVTISDTDNAASLAVTNNTVTTSNVATITSTSLTTGNGLLITGNGLTEGNLISAVTTAAGLTTGKLISATDGGGTFSVALDAATTIASSVNSTVALTVSGIQTNENMVLLDNSAGVIASDKAVLYLDAGGNIASGGNMLRLVPTGTPNAGAILAEIVGASKTCQMLYVDGDSTSVPVVAINGGGALTDGLGVLNLTNDGNLATGGNVLNITMGGTPHTAAAALEISAAKDAYAFYATSSAATNSAAYITSNGAIANNKAVLEVVATGTPANAGSNIVRIDGSGCTATNKPIMLELVGTGKDVSGLYSVSDNTTTHGVSIAGAGALASGGRMLLVTNTGTPAANTDSVAEVTFGGTATNNPIVLNVNNGTANAQPLRVVSNVASATRATATLVQDSTTGANYPLELQQDDVDQAILKITADTAGSGKTIDSDDKSGGTAVYIKIMIGATAYWIKATPGA